jgi:hypothetical protein
VVVTKEEGPFTVGSCTECDAGVQPMMIFTHSGVSMREEGNFRGFVHFAWGKERAQLDTEGVRGFLESLARCAEAADTDAFVMSWATKELGVPAQGAARLLLELRKFRERMNK